MRWAKVTLALALLASGADGAAQAATLSWKGHTWQVTSGGMAGVCQGDPRNVTVDGDGFLHLRIANSGGTWTSSELFTTDTLGFGTYQWQVDGPIDTFDQNVVLGLFPYGPAANIGSDGTNEIDIEYSRWGQANGPNGDWTDYPASGTTIGEMSYTFSLAGTTLSTSRFTWSGSSIADALLMGLQPIDGVTGLIKSWTYAPSMSSVNLPQQALPLGMNLWCFDAPPSDGNPVEIVIRDFVFVPAGAGGVGGAGGTAGGATGGAGGRPTDSGGAGGRPMGSGAAGGRSTGAGGEGGGAGGQVGSGGLPGATGGAGTGGRPAATGGTAGPPPAGTGGDAGPPSGGTGGTTGTGGGQSAGSTGDGGSRSGGCSCASGPEGPGDGASLVDVLPLSAVVTAVRRRRRGSHRSARHGKN